MATSNTVALSGTVTITQGSNVLTRTFSAAFVASVIMLQDLVLANGASNVVVSDAAFSNPGFTVILGGASVVRVNPGLHIASGLVACGYSTGSVGIPFLGIYAQIGSGASGPLALHLANSSGDSCTVTIINAM